MNKRNWYGVTPYIVLLVILVLIPFLVQNLYHLGVIIFILINTLLAVSLWFILMTGQVSLGHAGFAAIGGYMSAALVSTFGLSSWLSLFLAIVVAGIIATIIGYITLRITGIYFIVVTLALGGIIKVVFGMLDYPFGGLVGIMNLRPPDPIAIPGLPIVTFLSKPSIYYLILVFVLLGIVVMHRLSRSPIGLSFRGISQADILAEHVGINIMAYKVQSFVIGCMCAGLAGVLYTYVTQSIMPGSFTLTQSVYYLVYIAVGGGVSIGGPILGTVVLSILSEILRPIREFEPIIYGAILIVAVLFLRGGLIALVQELWYKAMRLPNKKVAVVSLKNLIFRNVPRTKRT